LLAALADREKQLQYAASGQCPYDRIDLPGVCYHGALPAVAVAVAVASIRLMTCDASFPVVVAAPKSRLKYLQTAATPWQQLLVYEVGQQGALAGPYSCSPSSSSSSMDSLERSSCAVSSGSEDLQGAAAAAAAAATQPGSGAGELQEALQLPQMAYSHLVYVCCK
jgi:hypothetical protein